MQRFACLAGSCFLLFAAAHPACAQGPTLKEPLAFAKMVARPGSDYVADVRGTPICVPQGSHDLWPAVRDYTEFENVFQSAAKELGYAADQSSSLIFGGVSTPIPAKFAVGGVLQRVRMDACAPYSGQFGLFGNANSLRGSMSLTIDWEVFSIEERKIILKRRVISAYQINENTPDGHSKLFHFAYRNNVLDLLKSKEFDEAVSRTVVSETFDPLVIRKPPAARKFEMSDAVGSVVLILAGGGHGSGFLVSDEGHILTAKHVVGEADTVRIRWSDGFETTGKVLRGHTKRDVALILSESRGRAPLPLRTDPPTPGEAVIAIGSPLDPSFQNTVTRGVASANRIIEGFSYIQSDVTVNPGNSGGPLIDEKGAVLGLSIAGYRPEGVPSGINLFAPTRDALDFLALEPR